MNMNKGKGVHREGDMTTGHDDCWPPTTPASWSTNVRMYRRGVVRYGDRIVAHSCNWQENQETHAGTYVGTSLARVNGRYVQKCGSPIQCDRADHNEDFADTCAYGGRAG